MYLEASSITLQSESVDLVAKFGRKAEEWGILLIVQHTRLLLDLTYDIQAHDLLTLLLDSLKRGLSLCCVDLEFRILS